MAAAATLPKTIFITTLPASVSPNNVYAQCPSSKIGTKRPFSLVSSPAPFSLALSPQQPSPPLSSTTNLGGSGSVWLPATLQQYKYEADDDYEYEDSDQSQYVEHDQPPRKRERLTHLSPEEKLFRRKMKNRIAAQTARDRKKAIMSDLEDTCRRLEEENDLLAVENSKLRQEQTSLADENERLRKLLADKDHPNPIGSTTCHGREDVRTVSAFGPAESINVPLPKEQAKAGWALTWLVASALIQLYSTCCDKSSEVEKLRRHLVQLKENGTLTVEEVLRRSPPEAIEKLRSLIQSYKTIDSKPP